MDFSESPEQFEKRKQDHIEWAMRSETQTLGMKDLEQIVLIHEAIPDINFKEVDTSTSFFSSNLKLNSPLFISSMTAGHPGGIHINERLASLSETYQILMGVGSQRKELITNHESANEWTKIRKKYPNSILMGNLGVSQLISTPISDVLRLIDSLEAKAFFIHTNPLQEVLQPEGTTDFKGAWDAVENLVKESPVPIVVKEVGCGFSEKTIRRLLNLGVKAVDLSSLGGTHWGRVEGMRSAPESMLYQVAKNFQNWGFTLVECMESAKRLSTDKMQFWASGGIRSGHDVAKCLAMGANLVGSAKPFLETALKSEEELHKLYELWNYELKIALFCTGSKNVSEIDGKYFKRG